MNIRKVIAYLIGKMINIKLLLSVLYYKIPILSFKQKRSIIVMVRRFLGYLGLCRASQHYRSLTTTSTQIASAKPFEIRHLSVKPLRILFISHDAARFGAQMVLIYLMRWLKNHAWVDMRLLLLGGGDLLPSFQEIAPTLLIEDLPTNNQLGAVRYFSGRVDLIYGNSAVSAQIYDWLAELNVPIITHVHELEQSLQRFAGARTLELMLRYTNHYITASQAVLDNLVDSHHVDINRGSVVHAFIEPLEKSPPQPDQRHALRKALGLKGKDILVFGCGTRDWRKGADLFVEVARLATGQSTVNVNFCWVGDGTDGRIPAMEQLIAQYGLENRVQLFSSHQNPRELFQAGDLFLLPSREDPFPLVCLEAAECGLPIICFQEAGSMPLFVADEIGFVVPFENIRLMAEKVSLLASDPVLRNQLGIAARNKLLATHISDLEVPRILAVCRELANKPFPLSVILPNYNCAPYLPQRLDSIFGQTFRDFETIILDDASTDASLTILNHYASRGGVRTVFDHLNSGNPFKQWRKGLEMARGEWVWIAESDDFCDPTFVDSILACFTDECVVLAYCQSAPVGPDGTLLGPDYLNWTDDLDPQRWGNAYRATGQEEIDLALAHKNAIINASAVIMRRVAALAAVEDAIPFRFAGDWITYAGITRYGDVVYLPETLNRHRRHPTANTSKMIGTLDWLAEDLAVKSWFARKGLIRGNPALQSICRTLATYEGDVRERIPGKPDLLTDLSLRTEYNLVREALEIACGGPATGDTILLVVDEHNDDWTNILAGTAERASGERTFVLAAIPEQANASGMDLLPEGMLWMEGTAGPLLWYDRLARDRSATGKADTRECRLRTVRQMCRLLAIKSVIPLGPEAARFVTALGKITST